MKIGLVIDDTLDSTDGVQQYVLTIGAWLSQRGHDVRYLAGETKRQDLPGLHSLGRNVSVRFNGNRLSIPLPTPRRGLRTLLERENFDILHVQMPYSPWLAGRLVSAAGPRTAIVGTFHIAPYSRLVTLGTGALRVWLKPSLQRFTAVVSVSSAAATFAKTSFGLTTPVIPNAIDYPLFHAAQALPQYADKMLTILFLGRLVPRKGCQVLLRAIAELRTDTSLPAFRVVICGKGPLESELKQYVARHQLGRLVSFVGFVTETDKPRYYASATIAVFPSSGGESFGIVLVEAMSSGAAAVLAGDNSGYRSVLNERPDLLFAPQDAHLLAERLGQFLVDTTKRQAAADWGARQAKRYDVAVVGQQLEALYLRSIAQTAVAVDNGTHDAL